MRDKNDRAGVIFKELLEPVDGIDVQVIGGLIQQEHLGLPHQGARQDHPPLLSAGKLGKVLFGVELHPGNDTLSLMVQLPAAGTVDLALDHIQATHKFRTGVSMQPVADVVILGQKLGAFAQAGEDDI